MSSSRCSRRLFIFAGGLAAAGLARAAEPAARVYGVLSLIGEAAITHLVLITKRRQDADFHLVHTTVGSGKLQGVGLYVDNQRRTTRRETGERTTGILGPYADARVALLEVESMRVLKAHDAEATMLTTPAHSATAVRAWDSLGNAGKIRALHTVVTKAVGEAAAELFAA